MRTWGARFEAKRAGGKARFHVDSRKLSPVMIDSDLPAWKELKKEEVWVEELPKSGGALPPVSIQPRLKIGILNLMPLKEPTELQLSRMLGRSNAFVEITWLCPDDYSGKNSAPGHLDKYYKRFSQVKGETFDGFIVTGAPIEHLPFDQVKYWGELEAFFDRIRDMDAGMLSLCWGAMASLYHFHKIPKHLTMNKQFGVYEHAVTPHPLLQAVPDQVGIPVSRHTTWKYEDFEGKDDIEILLASPETGPGLVWDHKLRHAHMINHFEYDLDTLGGEYWRDVKAGTPTGEKIHVPYNYFPGDNPQHAPLHTWKAPGQNFYSNWVQLLLRGGDGRARGR